MPLRAAHVGDDEEDGQADEGELGMQQAPTPVGEVAGHRASGGGEHREGDKRAPAEASGGRAKRRTVAAAQHRDDHRGKHELAADEERHRDEVQPTDELPHGRPRLASRRVNFARDVVEAAPPERLALVELARDGSRREYAFGEVAERSALLAGTLLEHGVGRGDVVMTLIGNRPEWVLTMVACFRIGAVVLPCTEQLRANDLRLRLESAAAAASGCDARNRAALDAAGPGCPVLTVPDERLLDPGAVPPPAPVELGPEEPRLIPFTNS